MKRIYFDIENIDYNKVVDYIMPKVYMQEVSRIGYLHWSYSAIENEYYLYHESLGLLITIGEEYVSEMMEKTSATSVSVLWALCGEFMWRYFAENNGFAERAILKMMCNK